jgi:hypothetical protein
MSNIGYRWRLSLWKRNPSPNKRGRNGLSLSMLSWRPIQLPPPGCNDCGPGGRRGTIPYHTILIFYKPLVVCPTSWLYAPRSSLRLQRMGTLLQYGLNLTLELQQIAFNLTGWPSLQLRISQSRELGRCRSILAQAVDICPCGSEPHLDLRTSADRTDSV